MQKDQVVSWCSAVQNHYSNQPVLKGIEGTEHAAFSVRAPAGFGVDCVIMSGQMMPFAPVLFSIFIHCDVSQFHSELRY